ncbi:MAG: hypothetical protein KJN94_09785, partial [Gammaproteobacteria bacterium]|nr:hypothetical protein [Gammaproteobacteria bacterium]
ITCTASYTVTQGDLNAGSVTNTAQASADGVNSNFDNFTLNAESAPSILIKKEIRVWGDSDTDWSAWMDANDLANAAIAVFPADAEYRLTVTNDGNVALKNVVVNDPDLVPPIVDYLIGALAVGQSVPLTQADIPELEANDRCVGRGTFTNNSTASGESVVDDTPVNHPDPAVLKCIGEAAITIAKNISVTGGEPWYPVETPPQEFPSPAWYQIVLTNVGTAPLENLVLQDGDLPIPVLEDIGTLGVGQSITLESGDIAELYVAERCNGAGSIGNMASITGNSVDDPSDTVDVSDDATLVCVGSPAIAIAKDISTDNSGWDPADTEAAALVTQAPSDAYYRITVSNTGPVGLTNVVLNDGTLGIVNHLVGDIGVGGSVELTNADIPALYYPGRCSGAGTFGNTANVQGQSAETGSETSLATNSAWLECTGTPEIRILKEISVNGGVSWEADVTAPVMVPSNAWYRLTVTNTGTTDLESVVVNDPTLGIVNFPIGDMLQGGPPVILTEAEIPALYQQNRCTSAGQYTNTASATGDSVDFPFEEVSWSNDVTLVCEDIDPNLCQDGKPAKITIRYDADSDTSNMQDEDSQIIDPPDAVFPPTDPVWITVHDHKDQTLVYSGYVAPYGTFPVSGPRKLISSSYYFRIYANQGDAQPLQTVWFHTSCSQPLFVGDEFGAITVLGGTH